MNAILAMTKDGGIGKNGTIPWHYSEDLKLFKHMTTGHVVVMGRKTFDSLGKKVLPDRKNIILSKTFGGDKEQFRLRTGIQIIDDPSKLKDILTEEEYKDCYIIGGSEIYKAFSDEITNYLISEIKKDHECDTFFDKSILDDFDKELVHEGEDFDVVAYIRKDGSSSKS